MFNSLLSFLAAFVLAFSYLAHGAPAVVHPIEDIVFSPAILYPTAGVVWATGSAQNVTWATNNLPAELQDGKGLLLLGHETDGSENLDISKCGSLTVHLCSFFFLQNTHLLLNSPSAQVAFSSPSPLAWTKGTTTSSCVSNNPLMFYLHALMVPQCSVIPAMPLHCSPSSQRLRILFS